MMRGCWGVDLALVARCYRAMKSHVPAIDGLRALAVTLVFADHAMPDLFPGGFIGVDIFFAISGFLITRILMQEHEATGVISLRAFYLRRLFRIYPALLLTVLVVLVAAPHLLSSNPTSQYLMAGAAITGIVNWLRAAGYGAGALSHTWSLGIEEQFYLLWPVAYLFLQRRCNHAKIVVVLSAAFAVIGLWRAALFMSGAHLMYIYNAFDTRADAILIGCILALCRPSTAFSHIALERAIFPLSCLALILFTTTWDSSALPLGGYTVIALASAWLVLCCLNDTNQLLRWTLGSSPLVWLGRRSYSLYLWHFPVLLGLSPLLDGASFVVASAGLSLAVADLSFRFVERPLIQFHRRAFLA